MFVANAEIFILIMKVVRIYFLVLGVKYVFMIKIIVLTMTNIILNVLIHIKNNAHVYTKYK